MASESETLDNVPSTLDNAPSVSSESPLERPLSTSGDDPPNELGQPQQGDSMLDASAPTPKPLESDPGCFSCFAKHPIKEIDVVCIGAGIMSATVALLLQELEPSWKIIMYERLHAVAEESSNGWNNAGTGHSGFMEPNYTKPVRSHDGTLRSVTLDKVELICEQFLYSRLYWDYLVKQDLLPDPSTFIHQTDHIAIGIGKDQCDFIMKRFETLQTVDLFDGMEIALPEEKGKQAMWAPLICTGRNPHEPICMTRSTMGTDVDYGALTKAKVAAFLKLGGDLRLFTSVSGLRKEGNGWIVTSRSTSTGRGVRKVKAKFVFVGAGGWALLMLQKAGIPQVRGYMALPVTADWAVCQNPEVVARHHVKVYAPSAPGAPPMSMPHLNYRQIGGKEVLLFGPFGSLTFKFLRSGSNFDALKALRYHNIFPTIGALVRNFRLATMLIKDVFKSGRHKLAEIRHYYPLADPEDWTLIPAGVRAQIIKKDPKSGRGMLQFGTDVVASSDGSICGVLGASPGASTCVAIALDTLEKCFRAKPRFAEWSPKLQKMISGWNPTGTAPADFVALAPDDVYKSTAETLGILPRW
eukprot:TRINITY_DN46711_c0_g1_i1.p1 TRINITY_DN46711_c0_g1~~TRINITY_DN46711_c0_g1_i1.p1  ORF type:complete len:582 (-),score=59.30 TRINITY_DN46711_c0_g1_i1:383-2128(-)